MLPVLSPSSLIIHPFANPPQIPSLDFFTFKQMMKFQNWLGNRMYSLEKHSVKVSASWLKWIVLNMWDKDDNRVIKLLNFKPVCRLGPATLDMGLHKPNYTLFRI